jgi:REP element-mobilizing transposase RayT
MGNTYAALYYHIVFSTKLRHPWITPDIEQRLWTYLGAVARRHKMTPHEVGGMPDHAHVLVQAPTVMAPSKIAQYLKGDSSKWIHDTFPDMAAFAWQEGYGVFTVSKSGLDAVRTYIQNQRSHHQTTSFEEEFRHFLKRHEVAYDEHTLWP